MYIFVFMKIKLTSYFDCKPQQCVVERILNPSAFHTVLDFPLGFFAGLNMSSHRGKPKQNKITRTVLVRTVYEYLLIVT